MNFMALVSCIILGDALRRIYRVYKQQNHTENNEKAMQGHFIILLVYLFSIVLKSVAEDQYLVKKVPKRYKASLIAYTLNVWLTFIVELMMGYLFLQFGKHQENAYDQSFSSSCDKNTIVSSRQSSV